ncbi:hypothetical protein BH10ACI1_BH10ACI1_19320 [soil metagenome]
MKKSFFLTLFFISAQVVCAQNSGDGIPSRVIPTPTPVVAGLSIAETIAKNLERVQKNPAVSREDRENAFAGLLEGQRFFWKLNPNSIRVRNQNEFTDVSRQARESFLRAIEKDPNLSEGYTALAELAWLNFRIFEKSPDLEETLILASAAVKLSPDNYGAHRLLAMAYTEKSDLQTGSLVAAAAENAIIQWREVARIDPRNAEAFAFLNLFYQLTGKKNEQIEALKSWLGASNPINSDYYQEITQSRETLSPDNASLKLSRALIGAGRAAEAIEYLNRAIAASPNDKQAVELLREAIEKGEFPESAVVIKTLQQAVFANPKNTVLILLLADMQLQNDQSDDAVKVLRDAIARMTEDEDSANAELQMKLGDVYLETEKYADAVAAFQTALKLRKIENSIVTEEERAFAMLAYEKIVRSYQNANRLPEAKAAIDRAKNLLGKDDIFADDLLIEFYRQTGKKDEAIKVVRDLRSRNKEDYGLLRLEATILTEAGRVDEAVALIKPLLNKQTTENPSLQFDDFTNYIFISTLYSDAKRGREAVQSANQAIAAARSDEEKQIAKVVLANAQQVSGDFTSAEATLRALLKQTPRNPMALNNLGYYLLERNIKFAEALDLIQQAIKIDPNNPSYLDSLGWAYFKLGKLAEAEKNMKIAARLSSTATIFEHLGDIYQKQNKKELAKSAWRKAVNLAMDKETSDRLKLKLSR